MILYIPIWLYSNFYIASLQRNNFSLYIPIWLYSNEELVKLQDQYNILTLHSNLVIFKSILAYSREIFLDTLHSNLVIFKWKSAVDILSSALAFTFQSGYIQIYPFIFYSLMIELYIPIWLYSNQCGKVLYLLRLSTLHSNLVIFKCRKATDCRSK